MCTACINHYRGWCSVGSGRCVSVFSSVCVPCSSNCPCEGVSLPRGLPCCFRLSAFPSMHASVTGRHGSVLTWEVQPGDAKGVCVCVDTGVSVWVCLQHRVRFRPRGCVFRYVWSKQGDCDGRDTGVSMWVCFHTLSASSVCVYSRVGVCFMMSVKAGGVGWVSCARQASQHAGGF